MAYLSPENLPTRHERQAPVWNGQPNDLRQFIRDAEDLFAKFKVPTQDWVTTVLKYVPSSHIDYWESLVSTLRRRNSHLSWEDFLKEVYAKYPGSGNDRRYTVADLERFVELRATQPMNSSADFAEYWRSFSVMGDYLTDQ
ncbi:hypothetical protein BKA70DRAFT_1109672, partial [Coprinopsis sp. MPI-PUGE-AT-0042]